MAVCPALEGTLPVCPYEDLAGVEGLLLGTGETLADEGEVALSDGLEEDVGVVSVSETEVGVCGIAVGKRLWLRHGVVVVVSSAAGGEGRGEEERRERDPREGESW